MFYIKVYICDVEGVLKILAVFINTLPQMRVENNAVAQR
jgi:hypothetical protein